MYKAVKIEKGSAGWGGPLVVKPDEKKNKILCMLTSQDICPLAYRIAEMTGATPVNGFKENPPDEEIMLAIVDCGGTARCGVYPKKRIPTINLTQVGPSGPFAKFIVEDIYVSDVTESCIIYVEGEDAKVAEKVSAAVETEPMRELRPEQEEKKSGIIVRIGRAVGNVVNKFFQAGRDSIDMAIKNILPFMAFTATILGIISTSGLGDVIANTISPFCSTLPGMVLISVVCAIPFLSPILGPGAVIAQVVGTLLGSQFALGHIPPQYALPALFAIDAQVGGDFVPVGLSLGEAESETVEFGVPAVLFSRLITGPLAVLIAFVFSIGMYKK